MIAGEQDGSSLVSSPFDEQIELQKRAIELLRLSDSSYLGCRDDEAGILREFIDRFVYNLSMTYQVNNTAVPQKMALEEASLSSASAAPESQQL